MAFEMRDCSSVSECNDVLVSKICAILRGEITLKNEAFLALSGGKSPIELFKMLSKKDLCWEKIYISLVDERITISESEDSNAKLIRTHLLQNNAKNAKFTPLVNDEILQSNFLQSSILDSKVLKTNEIKIVSPQKDLNKNLKQELRHENLSCENVAKKSNNENLKNALLDFANKHYHSPDIVILGMGSDGHFASLFGDAPEFESMLDSKENIVFITPQDAPYKRLSMSFNAIKKVKNVILYFCGKEKKMIFDKASRGVDLKLPISYILCDEKINCEVYYAD